MSRVNPSLSRAGSVLEPSEPGCKVELSISCLGLADLDLFSKSDPLCAVFMRSVASDPWIEVGRTEEISDCLNPNFATPIIVDYKFEEKQFIKFVLVDIDDRTTASLKNQDFLGEYETYLSKILTSPSSTITAPLTVDGRPHKGTITIRSEEVVTNKKILNFHFSASGLDKKDFFGKSDPFLIFSRAREDGTWVPVYKTEVIKKNLSPVWKQFEIPSSRLSNGDDFRTIRIDCFDWNSSGNHELIGSFETNQNQLTTATPGTQWPLIHPEIKKKKKKYDNSGELILLNYSIRMEHSFLEYVLGGCDINLYIAIDFTSSNKDPSTPSSLHYSPPNGMSDYEKAIRAVGEIISQYDSDGIFPVAGFGAKYFDPKTNQTVVSHCFELAPPNSIVGIEQVVQAYRNTLRNITLWGPTNFAQIIKWAAQEAAQPISQNNLHYTILLIVTDGIISDKDLTKSEIIKASGLPFSIIIVGVGQADFTEMDELDSDDALLTVYGKTAERDIVQFVPFRDFVDKPYEYLARHTLAEIPYQLTSYMKKQKFSPGERADV